MEEADVSASDRPIPPILAASCYHLALADPQGAIQFGRPAPLFRFFAPNKGIPAGKQPYDVTADGQRFIVSSVVRQADPVLHVLLNWPAIAAGVSTSK